MDIKEKDESTDVICIMGDFDARTANISDIMEKEDDLDLLNVLELFLFIWENLTNLDSYYTRQVVGQCSL